MASPGRVDEGNGWSVYSCLANDFNRFQIDDADIDIFVDNINWFNSPGGTNYRTLGDPGAESGIQFGVNNEPNTMNWLTSTDRNSPNRYNGPAGFTAVVVTGDSFQEDNSGGYQIHVRKHQ